MQKTLTNIEDIIRNEYRTSTLNELSNKYNKPAKYFRIWASKLGIRYNWKYHTEKNKKRYYCITCNKEIEYYKHRKNMKCAKCYGINRLNKVKRQDGSYSELTDSEKKYLIDNYPYEKKENIVQTLHLSWRQILKQARKLNIKRNRKLIAKYNTATWSTINNPMHNPDIVNDVRNKLKGQFAGHNNPAYGKVYYPIVEFNSELQHNIRSSWELNICKKLKENNILYEYEPEAFNLIIDGHECTYTPDLKIDNVYYEIKGPLFDKQLYKMLEFAKTHTLIVITMKKMFNRLLTLKKLDYNELNTTNNFQEALQHVY